jgi:sigma-54-specific transcriptional regulator
MATLPVWPLQPNPPSSAVVAGHQIFEDPKSKALLGEVEQVAPSDASVLISGETGTGKELIARYLHGRSSRSTGPFVVVSCGAFSDALVDAELFGYESGAFAGAFGTQLGWFEAADGGTIFLDEINELPMQVQTKLLRVLQEREIVRLGACKPVAVDVRVLAATTVDLEALVQAQRFRKELYYRLNVVTLEVLPLAQRPGDIVPLARYFLDLYSKRLGYPHAILSAEAESLLAQAPWHGNVRELENVIHRTLLLCDGRQIDAASVRLSSRHGSLHRAGPSASVLSTHPRPALPATPYSLAAGADAAAGAGGVPPADAQAALGMLGKVIRQLCEASLPDLYQQVEDSLLREVFRYCHYSQSETARLLGLSRNIVRARLIRLGEIAAPRNVS